MAKSKFLDQHFSSLAIIGIVAIVAIVTLIQGPSGIEGAQVYKEYVDDYVEGCFDDDSANDYYTAGIVTVGRTQYKDNCRNDKLYQYECATSTTVNLLRAYDCPNGCRTGACIR